MKKLSPYKIVVIAAIVIFLVLSYFPCEKFVTVSDMLKDDVEVSYHNNMSVVMVICLILQIVFLLRESPRWHFWTGLIGIISNLWQPFQMLLSAKIREMLSDVIVYCSAPCVAQIKAPTYSSSKLTTNGWIVVIYAWLLLGLNIYATVKMKKQKRLASSVENTPEDRDEVAQ